MRRAGDASLSTLPQIMDDITFRVATGADAEAMAQCHLADRSLGPPDPRVAAYLDGRHHPQQALGLRTAFLALDGGRVIGYIAGHRTRRFGYEGELQYLFVAPTHRRSRVASALLRLMAEWFADQEVRRVCVNVNTESPEAVAFYAAHGAVSFKPHWSAWEDIRTVVTPSRQSPA